ncbi:MAG: helix-turn-helix domain-containing protein [Patescibacteria group bacterium]
MKLKEKEQAIKLRLKGLSLKEISLKLNVSKGTVSIWVRDVKLSQKATERIIRRIQMGRYVSAERKKQRSSDLFLKLLSEARKEIDDIHLPLNIERLLCVMIYWCEGTKDYRNGVVFTNSDPYLVRCFMDLLVRGFGAKRIKFIARLHLHEYHNPKIQQAVWSKQLELSASQFRNPYLKKHTGKRQRLNYPGCISLRYYDSLLARKLKALAQVFLKK